MRFSLLSLGVFLSTTCVTANATPLHPLLTRNTHFLAIRTPQSTECSSGESVCGEWCIPLGYTCCPDLAGGCPSDETCEMGDNGQYGCCPIGEDCTGNGGVDTYDEDDLGDYTDDSSSDSGSDSGSNSYTYYSSDSSSDSGTQGGGGGSVRLSDGAFAALAVVAAAVALI